MQRARICLMALHFIAIGGASDPYNFAESGIRRGALVVPHMLGF